MSWREALRVAAQALIANRLRSALTTLGVVIGVLSVVLLVAIGQGARLEVTSAIEGLGSNLLFVFPGDGDFAQAPARSKFTLDDIDRIARELPGEGRVAGYVVSSDSVRADAGGDVTSIFGVTADYTDVVAREVARGQAIGATDVLTGRRVAVLGAEIAETVLGRTYPVGRRITISGLRFRVIGVLEEVGGAGFGPDRDEQVLIPVSTGQRLFGTDNLDAIFVQSPSTTEIERDSAIIERVLSRRLAPTDFSILTQDEIIGVVGDILEILTLVLAAIAGISLLVGGVGVSNIMLVSVSERTREIGLRKALGARTRDITVQFLLEAVVLTGLGGLLGLGLGIAGAEVVASVSPVPAVVTGWSVALALGVSVAVGIFFGVWPATRAGKLDPVEALRHE